MRGNCEQFGGELSGPCVPGFMESLAFVEHLLEDRSSNRVTPKSTDTMISSSLSAASPFSRTTHGGGKQNLESKANPHLSASTSGKEDNGSVGDSAEMTSLRSFRPRTG
jgi:hypothetical protein